jgi:hypothetical protein
VNASSDLKEGIWGGLVGDNMDKLLELNNLPLFIIGIFVVLLFNLFKGIVEFLWKLKQKQEEVRDSTVKELTASIKKTNQSINKVFSVLKIMAGDKWPSIRKEIMEEDDLES